MAVLKNVADDFLDALFWSCGWQNPPCTLIICGYQDEDSQTFKLIDGQQRITTL
ncbi:hypothetical protein [Helicobacter ailurogastricus]|uniref:hypothetical protein n=1 Tax=Helicobacter ailurogastricus TaxID=1578720 RepID=UPI001315321A|nr:hypothetical protein [Helicobacter ailurogastricus]